MLSWKQRPNTIPAHLDCKLSIPFCIGNFRIVPYNILYTFGYKIYWSIWKEIFLHRVDCFIELKFLSITAIQKHFTARSLLIDLKFIAQFRHRWTSSASQNSHTFMLTNIWHTTRFLFSLLLQQIYCVHYILCVMMCRNWSFRSSHSEIMTDISLIFWIHNFLKQEVIDFTSTSKALWDSRYSVIGIHSCNVE